MRFPLFTFLVFIISTKLFRRTSTSVSFLLTLTVASICLYLYSTHLHPIIFINYDHQPIRNGTPFDRPGEDPELSSSSSSSLLSIKQPSSSSSDYHQTDQPDGGDQDYNSYELNRIVDRALIDLRSRFASVWIQESRLRCEQSELSINRFRSHFLERKDSRPNSKHRVMVALNLHSSQASLSSISETILNLIRFIGPRNLYVSIYENGSWDHTQEGITILAQILTGLRVKHRIRTVREDTIWEGVDRITQLSIYRNQALKGFEEADQSLNLTELVFINDVNLCSRDVLELIYQKSVQASSATCGTDWRSSDSYLDRFSNRSKAFKKLYDYFSKRRGSDNGNELEKDPSNSVVFYDSWVARSITGKTLRPRLDVLTEFKDGFKTLFSKETGPIGTLLRTRFRSSLPIPVYSCWNGLIVLDARPFKEPYNLRFRSADLKTKECRSSECQLLAKDFWSLGFDRWVLVPSVSVTYSEKLYNSRIVERGSNRALRNYDLGRELIDWKMFERPRRVVCWPDMSTVHLDFEWNQVLESPYNYSLIEKFRNNQAISKNF
ncbi:CAP59 protein [Phakopsora pachyrhizi]|nr:CAP59 protein [Phakopsora pachyrhizi]